MYLDKILTRTSNYLPRTRVRRGLQFHGVINTIRAHFNTSYKQSVPDQREHRDDYAIVILFL